MGQKQLLSGVFFLEKGIQSAHRSKLYQHGRKANAICRVCIKKQLQSHGQRSLEGYSARGCKEAKQLNTHTQYLSAPGQINCFKSIVLQVVNNHSLKTENIGPFSSNQYKICGRGLSLCLVIKYPDVIFTKFLSANTVNKRTLCLSKIFFTKTIL